MKLKEPRHPVTKQILVGGFNPLDVSTKPFGYVRTDTKRVAHEGQAWLAWLRRDKYEYDEDPED